MVGSADRDARVESRIP